MIFRQFSDFRSNKDNEIYLNQFVITADDFKRLLRFQRAACGIFIANFKEVTMICS